MNLIAQLYNNTIVNDILYSLKIKKVNITCSAYKNADQVRNIFSH